MSSQQAAALNPVRDPGIDCARGLAMLLVVIGHSVAFAQLWPDMVRLIFTFHVPAFFFISGYLLRPSRLDPGRLARRILGPFLVVGLLLLAAKAVLRGEAVLPALGGLLWGVGPTLPTSQLWFLPALFVALLASGFVARRWGTPVRAAVAAGTLLALLVLGYLALQLLPGPPVEVLRRPGVEGPMGWPWSVDLLPIMVFFCLLGYLAGQEKLLARLDLRLALPAAALLLVCYLLGARVDLNTRLVEAYPLAIVAALSGTVVVMALGRWIGRLGGGVTTAFEAIGQHSILILAFHVMAQNAAIAVVGRLYDGPLALLLAALAGLGAGLIVPLVLSVGLDRAQARLGPGAQQRA